VGSAERMISAPAKPAVTKLSKPPPIKIVRGTTPVERVGIE
jgi:hypothetical protein